MVKSSNSEKQRCADDLWLPQMAALSYCFSSHCRKLIQCFGVLVCSLTQNSCARYELIHEEDMWLIRATTKHTMEAGKLVCFVVRIMGQLSHNVYLFIQGIQSAKKKSPKRNSKVQRCEISLALPRSVDQFRFIEMVHEERDQSLEC